MPPLLCRILKLRKISAKLVMNNKGQTGVSVTFSQILSSWQPQKVIRWQIFLILDFDRSTGAKSSPSPKITFSLKMTKF